MDNNTSKEDSAEVSLTAPLQDFEQAHKEELAEILLVLVKITSRTPEQIKPHLNQLLEGLVISPEQSIVPTQRRKAFQEWVESHRDLQLPLLDDQAISRESIYGERG